MQGPVVRCADRVSKSELTTLARSTFELGATLQQTLVRDRAWASRNVVISPYSLCEAFGLVYAGARGDTAREIADAMRYGLTESQVHIGLARLRAELAELEATPSALRAPVELLIANSAWAQTGLDIEPLTGAGQDRRERRRRICARPDEARAKSTAGSARTVASPSSSRWLAGERESPSWPTPPICAALGRSHFARPAIFRILRKTDGRVQIPTMHGALHAGYIEAPDYQAAELRYVGDRLSLFLVLPARGKFAQVEQGLNAALLSGLAEALPRARRNLRVSLPKVNLSVPLSLGASLAELGMKRAFGQGADFSGGEKRWAIIGQVATTSTWPSTKSKRRRPCHRHRHDL
jgi:serpin B